MSFLTAVATTDGKNIDQHFGHAKSLKVYQVEEDGTFQLQEERLIPRVHAPEEPAGNHEENSGCGCGGRRGGGCGCGRLRTMDVSFLDPVVNTFADCRYILASRVGPVIDKAFGKRQITTFSIDLPVQEALGKIAVYETRIRGKSCGEYTG